RHLDAGHGQRAAHHGLARREKAGRRRIAVVPILQRLDRRLDDMAWRLEVRLADAEIDNVLACRGKRGGAGKHGEGVLFAQSVEGGDRLEHFSYPSGAKTKPAFLGASRCKVNRSKACSER